MNAAPLERVRAAVTRTRVSSEEQCTCAACRRVQRRAFHCNACGYTGQPVTMDCRCAKNIRGAIEFDEGTLRTYPTRAAWPKDWKTTRARMARDLIALRSLGPIGRCKGHGTGMPATGAQLFGFKGNCCHSAPICPVCDDTGDGASVNTENVLAALREVNAVLSSHAG